MGAALERALQGGQALSAVAFVNLEVVVNGNVFHPHTAAHRVARIDQGHWWFAAGHQQSATVGLGGRLGLQQGFEPRFGRGVARNEKGAELCVFGLGGFAVLQTHAAQLAAFGIDVAQAVCTVEP